jgi:hypothetical protein
MAILWNYHTDYDSRPDDSAIQARCPHGNVGPCAICQLDFLLWARTLEHKPATVRKVSK